MAPWFSCRHPEQVRLAQARVLAPGLQGAPQEAAAHRRRRHWTVAAVGAGWLGGIGLAAWGARADPALVFLAVAFALALPVHAAATGYRFPGLVVAGSAPLLAASLYVVHARAPTGVAGIASVLVALHALVAWRLLVRNWGDFTRAIDAEVERGRFTAMLHEQKDLAERAVQQKTRFLASASHDLRQPMHAISLYLDGLAEADLPDRVREAVADARLCAHDMNDMFRSLLDISRLDAEQAVPALGVFPVARVLSRVDRELRPLAVARGVRLQVRACPADVFSDAVMVERIVLNFVSNAVRHAGAGRVLVGARRRGAVLRLAVYDTGHGIPLSQQQAIFEEFRRLESSVPSDATGGLGLGLAIVRRLALTLRLTVTVRSTPGRGSMFAVDLPLVHAPRSQDAADTGRVTLAGRLVVIVDDEPSILQALSFILEAAGCEVVTARSADEARQAVAGLTRVPDAIVCDYELGASPHGADAIDQLRDEFAVDIPALLVTGQTAGGRADAAGRERGIPVLHKPLEAAALKAALERLLKDPTPA